MSEFIYKLNAMELAAKAFSPHEHGYKQKRLDVISHVESLQAELTSLRTENENFSRAYGLLSVANEQFARDIKALRTELESANARLEAAFIAGARTVPPSVITNDAPGVANWWQWAPMEPTPQMLDVAVSYALNVSVSGEGGWSRYMATIYKRMLAAATVKDSLMIQSDHGEEKPALLRDQAE